MNDTVRIRVESSSSEPLLRELGGATEILVPVTGTTTITQQIDW